VVVEVALVLLAPFMVVVEVVALLLQELVEEELL
jgi:hypothetical protein